MLDDVGVIKPALFKGSQWVFIVPDHKAGYFLGGKRGIGGVPLGSHDFHHTNNSIYVCGVVFCLDENVTRLTTL